VSKAFPDLSEEKYIYNWLLINARTFYYVAPGTGKIPKPDDCLALNPFGDYFNHSDQGCEVTFGAEGFTITSDRVYKKGEEVYISYGKHSNDFLLAEYGFVLAEKSWDEARLDSIILPRFNASQCYHLRHAGFYGNYALDSNGICHRSQVALRLLCLPLKAWKKFVSGGESGDKDQPKVNKALHDALKSYESKIKDVSNHLSTLTNSCENQRGILDQRWTQILHLLQTEMKRIQS